MPRGVYDRELTEERKQFRNMLKKADPKISDSKVRKLEKLRYTSTFTAEKEPAKVVPVPPEITTTAEEALNFDAMAQFAAESIDDMSGHIIPMMARERLELLICAIRDGKLIISARGAPTNIKMELALSLTKRQ